jgi:hypothetical protein
VFDVQDPRGIGETVRVATGRSPDAVDSGLGSATRFLSELTAWVAAPWAAARVSWLLAAAVLVVLVALPSVFNVPGDKHQSAGVAVPGAVRIAIELVLFGAAVAGAVLAWPTWAWLLVIALVAVTVVAQLKRWRWLLSVTPST